MIDFNRCFTLTRSQNMNSTFTFKTGPTLSPSQSSSLGKSHRSAVESGLWARGYTSTQLSFRPARYLITRLCTGVMESLLSVFVHRSPLPGELGCYLATQMQLLWPSKLPIAWAYIQIIQTSIAIAKLFGPLYKTGVNCNKLGALRDYPESFCPLCCFLSTQIRDLRLNHTPHRSGFDFAQPASVES